MKSGTRLFIPLAVFIFLSSVPLRAAGDFAGNVLLRPPAAKPAGMAEAVSSLDARETGASSFHYNPAAPSNLAAPQISFMGQKGIADDLYGSLFYGHPTVLGSFSLGAVYYSLGDIQLVNTSNVSTTVNAEKDYALSLNYAEEFFGALGTGITIKYLNSKLVDAVSATSFAFDVGIKSRLENDRLALGFSVLNIGSDLKYLDAPEPLPLTVRLGGSYRLNFQDAGRAILALDLVKERENDFKKFIGADYIWNELISVRGGYKIGQEEGNLSAGFGFVTAGFTIDYAITNGKLGQIHSASLSCRFGDSSSSQNNRSSERERAARAKEIHKIRKSMKSRSVKVAVLGLNSLGAGENSAAVLADELFLEFSKAPKVFDLVDPVRVRDHIRKSGVDLAQCTEVRCLKDVGAALGAEKLITGLLTLSQGQYSLTVQMLDVGTGSIEVTEAVKASNMKDMKYEIRSIIRSLAKSAK